MGLVNAAEKPHPGDFLTNRRRRRRNRLLTPYRVGEKWLPLRQSASGPHVDYNARLYDPAIGRFLSVDPLIAHPGSTQSINPYSYVENNPLNKTDPTGEAPMGCMINGGCFGAGSAYGPSPLDGMQATQGQTPAEQARSRGTASQELRPSNAHALTISNRASGGTHSINMDNGTENGQHENITGQHKTGGNSANDTKKQANKTLDEVKKRAGYGTCQPVLDS